MIHLQQLFQEVNKDQYSNILTGPIWIKEPEVTRLKKIVIKKKRNKNRH